MPIHISAFTSSIAGDGVLHQLDEVQDDVLPASNLGLLTGVLNKLLGVAAVGATMTRAQFVAPSLRNWGPQDIEPINIGTAIESPPRAQIYYPAGVQLATSEEVDMYAAQDSGDPEDDYAFVWFMDGITPCPPGRMLQAHWTASTTLVAGTWSKFAVTLDNPLAAGTYAVVGAHVVSAGAIAFRFLPSGGPVWRPGGLAAQAADQYDLPLQRRGGLGQWMMFTNTTIPQMEIFSESADTSEEGTWDLVPIGS